VTKNRKQIAIAFLTFNSDKTIRNSLKKASKISRNIYVVDSFSSDKTIEICKSFHCKIIKRKFKNYSEQRNWIIKKLNKKNYLWQLHLDADEVLDFKLIKKINHTIKNNKQNKSAFLIKRKYYFLNKKINFPGLNEWHLRLFKSRTTYCENTLYDQHFITNSSKGKIYGYVHDNDKYNLKQWKQKHVKWASFEAKNFIKKNFFTNKFKYQDDPRYFYRSIKIIYYKLPLFVRPCLYFIFRYFFKLGFLDGKIGFMYIFYQCLWFRFLVDKNIYKLQKLKKD
tara:strand:- start:656 stop:1498 length:843 start_codon:yes stop_codon:yes gene_type:complete